MLKITENLSVPLNEIEITATLAGGPGGQHVNKVSSAIHLRFNIKNSSLPDSYKERLLNSQDRRITKEGVIIIKAQQSRSQIQNKEIALGRLLEFLRHGLIKRKKRVPTKPTKASREKRLQSKNRRSRLKQSRGKVDDD